MKTSRSNFVLMALCAILAFPFAGCQRKGCTDRSALNYEAKAKKDDGDCTYSTVIFHSNTEGFQGLGTIGHTTIKVDGSTVGTIGSYQSLAYPLRDGNIHNWRAEIEWTYEGSTINLTNTGVVAANPNQPTIMVDVWD